MRDEPGLGIPPLPEMTSIGADRPPEDLAILYRREHEAMVRLASVIVGSRSLAEEIVQDSFEAISRRWTTLTNPGGYLRTTVVNGCRMALRRRAREQRRIATSPTVLDGPAELVELHDALGRLSDRARIAVVLRYLVGLSAAEIAEVLDCRVATVRSIAHRALGVLRKELS